MNVDVERQVREYAAFLEANMPATDALSVIESAETVATITRGPAIWQTLLRRPFLAATVAMAAVLLAVGGLGLFLSTQGGSSPADDPTTPTLSPGTTAAPDTTLPTSSVEPFTGNTEPVVISARWTTAGSAVEEESGGVIESSERVERVWFVDAGTWRREVSITQGPESAQPEEAVTVVSEGERFDYYSTSNTFEIVSYDPAPIEANPQIAYDFWFECSGNECINYDATETFGECTVTEGVEVLGFPTTEYVCSRIPERDTDELITMTINLDSTGRTLKGEFASGSIVYSYEVLSLDADPVFDPALFEFKCPTEDCTDGSVPLGALDHPWVGQPVPEVSGDLLGGGAFDIADHTGEKIVLLLWASWCPPCHQALQDLEQLSIARSDLTVVTGAVLDTAESVTALTRELGITLPVIDLYSRDLEGGSYLDDIWGPPDMGIPVLAFIDETGTIIAVHIGHQGSETITETLDEVGW